MIGQTWTRGRIVRVLANFVIGLAFFVAGGWFGQWGFTWNLRKVLVDIIHSGEFRAVPASSMGNYGLVWHTAYFETCGISASGCVGGVPADYVVYQDALFFVVSMLEVVWFLYLVWRSVKVQ
jgi:hypothetical protein